MPLADRGDGFLKPAAPNFRRFSAPARNVFQYTLAYLRRDAFFARAFRRVRETQKASCDIRIALRPREFIRQCARRRRQKLPGFNLLRGEASAQQPARHRDELAFEPALSI